MRKLASRFVALLLGALTFVGAAEAQRLIVTDSGANERTVSRLFVVDSGGTTRQISRLFVIDSGGTARLVFNGLTYNVAQGTYTDNFPTFAQAAITYASNGQINVSTLSAGSTLVGYWVLPTSVAPGDHEIRVDVTSGSLSGGSNATGTWLALTSSRTWLVAQEGIGFRSVSFTVQIRDASDTVVASGSITLSATSG